MEADGKQLWRLLRPEVRARGPLKVLRRIGPDGYLSDRLPLLVERLGPKRVLKQLHIDEKSKDLADAAWEALANFSTPGKRLYLPTRDAANHVALSVLDACADLREDNPAAMLAGSVAEVIGTKVASMEFDSGVPGSGQVMEVWRVGKKMFVTGEIGAFAVCDNLNELVEWWIDDWPHADIKSVAINVTLIKALGLVRCDADSWAEGSVRINGCMWRRP